MGVPLEPQEGVAAASDATTGCFGLSAPPNPTHWVAARGTMDALRFLLDSGWQPCARAADLPPPPATRPCCASCTCVAALCRHTPCAKR